MSPTIQETAAKARGFIAQTFGVVTYTPPPPRKQTTAPRPRGRRMKRSPHAKRYASPEESRAARVAYRREWMRKQRAKNRWPQVPKEKQ